MYMKQFISGPNIPVMKPVHEDDRRAIREATMTMPGGSLRRVTSLAIKQSGVLGNHYHNHPEYFSVLSGNPTVLTAPREDPDSITVRNYPDGGHIVMQPGEAHAFHFDEPGELISSMDGAFDPNDMHPLPLKHPDKQQ